MLQSMGSKRVGHSLVTEQQMTILTDAFMDLLWSRHILPYLRCGEAREATKGESSQISKKKTGMLRLLSSVVRMSFLLGTSLVVQWLRL